MAGFPFERYVLTSPLTLEQIAQKVRAGSIEADEYTATLKGNTLYIKPPTGFRIGGYSQSFKPAAIVRIQEMTEGSKLMITISPKAMAVVLLFLVAILLFASALYSQRAAIGLGQYKNIMVVAMGLVVLGYLLPVTAFNTDIEKLKSFTADFFETDQNG